MVPGVSAAVAIAAWLGRALAVGVRKLLGGLDGIVCRSVWVDPLAEHRLVWTPHTPRLGLYKILFYFEAFVYESIIRVLPPPTCIARTIAMLLHVYCARYDAPPTPLFYAIHHTILVMAISCKGQASAGSSTLLKSSIRTRP